MLRFAILLWIGLVLWAAIAGKASAQSVAATYRVANPRVYLSSTVPSLRCVYETSGVSLACEVER